MVFIRKVISGKQINFLNNDFQYEISFSLNTFQKKYLFEILLFYTQSTIVICKDYIFLFESTSLNMY